MTRQPPTTEAATLKREHASLNREIADWREWWGELSEMGEPHFGEMGDRLSRFRDHLAAHFAHEESQECLAVVTHLPAEGVTRMAQLRDEHSGLLDELDRLVSGLHSPEPGYAGWGEARQVFESFLDRLDAHEQAEDALLDQIA